MELNKTIRDVANLGHCIGQLIMWELQDTLMLVDDGIVELPDE